MIISSMKLEKEKLDKLATKKIIPTGYFYLDYLSDKKKNLQNKIGYCLSFME